MVGSQWVNGSSEILLAALAGPARGCKYYGDFYGLPSRSTKRENPSGLYGD